jgi:hypothetical protein
VLHPSAWLLICGSLPFSSLGPPYHVLELLQSGLLLPMHKDDSMAAVQLRTGESNSFKNLRFG